MEEAAIKQDLYDKIEHADFKQLKEKKRNPIEDVGNSAEV